MHIPVAAALAFSSGRVRGASLAYSAQPLSDGIPEQISDATPRRPTHLLVDGAAE